MGFVGDGRGAWEAYWRSSAICFGESNGEFASNGEAMEAMAGIFSNTLAKKLWNIVTMFTVCHGAGGGVGRHEVISRWDLFIRNFVKFLELGHLEPTTQVVQKYNQLSTQRQYVISSVNSASSQLTLYLTSSVYLSLHQRGKRFPGETVNCPKANSLQFLLSC